jgi:hypothetical protein
VEVPQAVPIPEAIAASEILQRYLEQQQENHDVLIRQLRGQIREMKAQQMTTLSQTTLERFFIPSPVIG